jgi:hypothetical protein
MDDIPALTRNYLSKKLTEQEFNITEGCLKRLNLDFDGLFWFMEDARVHNQMRFIAQDKKLSVEKVFSKEEQEIIRKAEAILNNAPMDAKEELRSFCHF